MSDRSSLRLRCSAEVAEMLPASLAHEHHVFPFLYCDGVLTLAVSAPLTNDEVEKLKFLLDCEIVERIEACEDIIESIQWTYGLSYLDGIDY